MSKPSPTKYHFFSFTDDDGPWSPLRTASSVSSISGLTTNSSLASSQEVLPHSVKDSETCSLFSELSSIPNVTPPWSVQLCSALGEQFRIIPKNESEERRGGFANDASFPKLKKNSVPCPKTAKKPATIIKTAILPAPRYQRTFDADPVTFDWGEFWETRRKCLHWLQKYCITSSGPTKKSKRR